MSTPQKIQIQLPLGCGVVSHLRAAALQAARRGDVERADAAELEFIRRTRLHLVTIDGRDLPGSPQRVLRGFGKAGRLAIEWCTIDGTKYTDIDGKEIANDEAVQDPG